MPASSKLKRVVFAVVSLGALVALGATGVLLFGFWLFLELPGNAAREIRELTISPGMNARAVSKLLYGAGVISDPQKFYYLCQLRKVGQKLQAGQYAFLPLSTPDQILDQIASGRVLMQRVTLPEGSTVRDVARIIEEKGLASHRDVLRLATDEKFIKNLGLTVPSLEGYLFPETYRFQKSQSISSMLKTMVDQFRLHLPYGWQDRTNELGLSLHDLVTMASMIEKEAVVDVERPLISAVFFNRLRLKMPLQSDPTVIYGLSDFSGPITGVQLKRQSPYNTYQNKGLPAGPICNPGGRSLWSALHPEKVSYLYFVSNSDGTHHFSETLEEHHRAVARYRERRQSLMQNLNNGNSTGTPWGAGNSQGGEAKDP